MCHLIKTTLCSPTRRVGISGGGENEVCFMFCYRANIVVIGVKQLLGLYILMC